jgi:hypothetical protein
VVEDPECGFHTIWLAQLRNCSQRGRVGRCRSGCYFEANEG